MNQLNCSVNSCSSNSSGCCCRPSIQVAGCSAHVSVETCCDSFIPDASPNNACGYCTPNPTLEIACSAGHCMYNKNHKCTSSNVQIACGADGTECKTFKE